MDAEPTSARTAALAAYRHAGRPTATVYLPLASAIEDPGPRLALARRTAVAQAEDAGAPAATVAALGAVLDEHDHSEGEALVAVVAGEECVFCEPLLRPVDHPVGLAGPVAALLPYLAATQVDRRHLVVVLDRTGADIYLRDGVGEPTEVSDVEGDTDHIHRGRFGGWSQRRFQQVAENTWEQNAKAVAEEVASSHSDVELVAVAGDVRAVGFFREHLPARFESHELGGSRHADVATVFDQADRVLRTRAAEDVVMALDRLRSAVARGAGVAGSAVIDMLRQGRVRELLVADDTFAPDRPSVDLDIAGGEAHPAPATDAAVALAAATGAEVTVVPATGARGLEEGLGAVLRG